MAAAANIINPLILSFSTLFLVSILLSFPATTTSDNPCAYPCYPPPTGTGSTTPVTTTTPPPPSTQTGSYPPPPTVYNNPTGSGYSSYNPPPSTYNGGGGYAGANPPPDPILPYFPFYYKNGARGNGDASSATPLFNTIATTNILLVFVFFFFL